MIYQKPEFKIKFGLFLFVYLLIMYPKKQTVTVAEAQKKMERYCAYQDRCHKEVMDKLTTMRLIPEAKEKILLHLIEHNFVNEERFARNFARGKFRIKKWGKQRITQELKQRQISVYNIKTALKEIPEAEYLATFQELAQKKFDSLSTDDIQKNKKKCINYLLYRGWETSIVFETVNELFSNKKL